MMDDMLSGSGGEGGSVAPAAPAFDGKIVEWPEQAIKTLFVPKEKNDFLIYMSCELFKAQHITDPKSQARKSLEYANALYSELSSRGLF